MQPFKKLKTGEETTKDVKTLSKPANDSDLDNGQDWRADCNGIRDINSRALRKNILTDVTFYVGGNKEVFHAHRLILALGSPVFEAMFYGPLAEKGDTVTIPDVDPEGFQHLLKFLYCERTVLKDDAAAIKTALAADKYCMSSLKQFCENFLYSYEMSTVNVWMLLQHAIYLNLDNLKFKCLLFLKCHTEAAFVHSSFLEVNANTIETVICQNAFAERMSEKKILQYVMHWAHHNSNPEDKDSFKNVLTPLLKYIRFDHLDAKVFVHLLEVSKLNEVLGSEDALAILKHITLPSVCPLPEWCSKTKRVPLPYVPHKLRNDGVSKGGLTVRCFLSSPNSRDSQSPTSQSPSSGIDVQNTQLPFGDSNSTSTESSSSDYSD